MGALGLGSLSRNTSRSRNGCSSRIGSLLDGSSSLYFLNGSRSFIGVGLNINVDKRLAHLGHLARFVVELLDGTGKAAGDFHRGLVALHLAKRRELLDLSSRLDEPLDDLALYNTYSSDVAR